MSASQKLIINEDLTACLVRGEKKQNCPPLCTCVAYGEVAFVALQAAYECHCIHPLCVCVFEAEHIDGLFPSNCLFIQAVILSVCFLKLFVYMCQVSCSNTAVVCVDSAPWRLPLHSTTSCSAGSSSAPCTFLIQHLWVVSWPASPGTWMKVRLDLSWLRPLRALSQWSHPGWQSVVPRHSVAFRYPLHWCLSLTCWFVGCCCLGDGWFCFYA